MVGKLLLGVAGVMLAGSLISQMLLFYSVFSQSNLVWGQHLPWLNTVVTPVPLLPALASVLFFAVLALQSPVRTVRKLLFFSLGGIALFWLLHQLAPAINFYLSISMALLIMQSFLSKPLGRARERNTAAASIVDNGLVALSQAHYLPESTGTKAARLGKLIEAGYNVPDGFVFTREITNKSRRHPNEPLLTRLQSRKLDKLWNELRTNGVAVRSSEVNEDGFEAGFAGVYESMLDVTRDSLEKAVKEVYQSMCSDRSTAYTQGIIGADRVVTLDHGGVLVQKMIHAEYAGVMFTEHPGTSAAMMVEIHTDPTADLLDSNVTPDTFAYGKLTSQLLQEESGNEELPPVDMAALLNLGRELESLFGQPQYVDWAYANGRFYLLQVRDITRSVCRGDSLKSLAERERSKLLHNLLGQRKRVRRSEQLFADEPVYVQSELSELLPRPTPFSSDFMERLWSDGGSTHLACQELEVPYKVHSRSMPYINTIFGWTYVNKQEERRRLGNGPGALALFRLTRNADVIEAQFREEFLPQFQSEMVERNAIAVENLTLAAATSLLQAWIKRFVENTYRNAERINISADFYMKNALEKLNAAQMEPTRFLMDDEETVVSQAMSLLDGQTVTPENIDQFLMIFGHRAPLDYEFSAPRFNEDMNLVRQFIEHSARASDSDGMVESIQKDIEAMMPALPDSKGLASSVQRARNFTRLKEEVKHFCLIELAQIRRLLLTIDSKCHLDGRIFQLRIDEVVQLDDPSRHDALIELADQRFTEAHAWKSLQLPASLSINDLERIDMLTGTRPDEVEITDLSGKRVAGEQEVVGTVRVITHAEQIKEFREGEILIARMTDPTWYPLFSQARGIVTEIGGWLSHAAILAREYDLPTIVGMTGICERLNTGDVIRMTLAGSVEILENRRTAPSKTPVPTIRFDSGEVLSSSDHGLPLYDDDGQINVFKLTSRRMFRYQLSNERRAMKHRLSDRRTRHRLSASGTIEPDRRADNRQAANMKHFKKTG